MNEEFQRIARRDKKDFLNGQCKEIEENSRMGSTHIHRGMGSRIMTEHMCQDVKIGEPQHSVL